MAGTAGVEVRALTRTYRRRNGPPTVALDGVDLTIPAGEVHGLLGPNGAGKTTLCKILSTVLLPTAGTAAVAGHDVVAGSDAVRRSIGIVFGGERGLYTRLTARQNLRYWAALYRMPAAEAARRADALLARVGLSGRAGDRVETYSRGMKQRLHLARGLVGDPRVLILDEPTAGLDPAAAVEFRSLVGELRDEGRTVLITTHDMAEAEAACDRVSLIDGGRIIGTEDPRTIGRWIGSFERVRASGVSPGLAERLRQVEGVASVTTGPGGEVTVETGAPGVVAAVLRLMVDAGVTAVTTDRPSLAEVYLHLVGDRGLELR